MSCKCAFYNEGRYRCSVSGDGCVYLIPDSKRCAEEYGEGPDAPRNKCEECKDFYLENGKRCCKREYSRFVNDEFVKSKYIENEVVCCGGFQKVDG